MRTTSSLKVGGSTAGAVAVSGRTARAAARRRRIRMARTIARPLTPPGISSTIVAAVDAREAERRSDTSWRQTIEQMHASGRQVVLAITGGGSGAIAELLRVPGGSRLLLEALVPYDARSLTAFLGVEPGQACSLEPAVAMAQRARERAAKLVPTGAQLVGLGATAGLVTDRPRQGEHRFHLAATTEAGTDQCSVVLAKGRRDRPGEEDLVARAIVLWLGRACGVAVSSPRSLLDADERYAEAIVQPGDPVDQLLADSLTRVTAWPDGQLAASAPPPAVVLPGSFNPLHDGHLSLARVAEEIRQQPVAFEISVTNVDKPPLAASEVRNRLAQFAWRARVELTRAPTFLEKSRLFPGATFVLGAEDRKST